MRATHPIYCCRKTERRINKFKISRKKEGWEVANEMVINRETQQNKIVSLKKNHKNQLACGLNNEGKERLHANC